MGLKRKGEDAVPPRFGGRKTFSLPLPKGREMRGKKKDLFL
jgi:hypothetical protein